MHQWKLGRFNHMRIEHQQERSTSGKALVKEGGRCHSQLAKAVLDGYIPDAGDRHQARPTWAAFTSRDS